MDTSSLLNSPAGSHWQRIGVRDHHGINLPLFSLRGKHSSGIGEYPDLIPMISWCRQQGLDVIQLLPLNDTGNDTSPYSALSAFALNPLHIGLSQLPHLENHPNLQAQLPQLNELNKSQRIEYPRVLEAKTRFLRDYFSSEGNTLLSSSEYQRFLKDNDWLYPYALFKTLKAQQQWSPWDQWDDDIREITNERFSQLLATWKEEIDFHLVLQFLAFMQMEQVKAHADQQGVFLKGDIPILINRESADVWFHQNLFHLGFSAGSPPDMYSEEGQNWGFPIYNWRAMEREDYHWWKERLRVASRLYHLYRLDHVVGFFRIWAIPRGAPGHEGAFDPQDQKEWIPQGRRILEMMLRSAPILPIAEDLGTVPPESRVALQQLGICGTKVIRWERRWNQDKSFIAYDQYSPISMTTVSTHDSETLQLWWKNNPQEAKDFAAFKGWDYRPELSLERHEEILRDSHHTPSLFHINLLQEYLALIPGATWPKFEDERINIPGKSTDQWTYRFRPTIEEIISNKALIEVMKRIKAKG